MDGLHDVYLSGQPVGKVLVERRGLYWLFSCRCRLSGEIMYKLSVTCGETTENLGVLVPDGKDFSLKAKLPAKRLGAGEMKFQILPRHKELAGKFIPLSPEKPFAYLSRLENAFLEVRNGQPGISISGGLK